MNPAPGRGSHLPPTPRRSVRAHQSPDSIPTVGLPPPRVSFLHLPRNIVATGETLPVEELLKRQNGWLDFANGVWHLVLEDDDHPVRYWNDMIGDLAELASDDWMFLSGPMKEASLHPLDIQAGFLPLIMVPFIHFAPKTKNGTFGR